MIMVVVIMSMAIVIMTVSDCGSDNIYRGVVTWHWQWRCGSSNVVDVNDNDSDNDDNTVGVSSQGW